MFPFFLCSGNEEVAFSSLEEIYTPKYCLQLEAAYGEGMMSEGGAEGIEYLFDGIALDGKVALDIGSGLGGAAFHLADKHAMQVVGLEVNSWMVAESKTRMPIHLKSRVDFLQSSSNSSWPILGESFDMIYSKGVFTHIETKNGMLQECHRLLKNEGLLVISDCLSSQEKRWGKNIARLVELEKLPIFAESESGYIELLKKNGFNLLSVRNDTLVILRHNQEIIKKLKDPLQHQNLLNYFDEVELEAAIEGYESTDVQPGWVDTDMAKGEDVFWMASSEKAAEQIYSAIKSKRAHAYITRRWRLYAWLLKLAPRWIYHRFF
ncbi:MAG: methyltransferase domain-containing protein [Chlamydiota bacterium]